MLARGKTPFGRCRRDALDRCFNAAAATPDGRVGPRPTAKTSRFPFECRLMTLIDQAARILDYRFNDGALLREALTHASSAGSRLQSNERMEFLGDAILGFVVCDYLYNHYTDLLEGELTKIKSTVVSRRTCAKVSERIQLTEMLNLGKGMEGRQHVPHSVAAAVFESVVAAIALARPFVGSSWPQPCPYWRTGVAGQRRSGVLCGDRRDGAAVLDHVGFTCSRSSASTFTRL